MKSNVETCVLVSFFLCGVSAVVFSIASVFLDHWAVVSIPQPARPSYSGGGLSFSDALDVLNELSDSIGDDGDGRRPSSDFSLPRNPASSSSSGSSSSGSSSSGSSSFGSSSSGSSSSGSSSSGSSSSGSSSSGSSSSGSSSSSSISGSFPSNSFNPPSINIPDFSSSNFRPTIVRPPTTINRPSRFPGRRRRRSTDGAIPIFSFSPRTICASTSTTAATLDDFQCVSFSDLPERLFSDSHLKKIEYLTMTGVAGVSVGVFLFMISSCCDSSISLYIGLVCHAIAALLYLVGVILFSMEDSFSRMLGSSIFSSVSEQSFGTPYHLSIVAIVFNSIVFFIGCYGACCSKRNAL